MAGREELYLKCIAVNTERIAKALEKLVEARTVKDVKFDSEGLKLTYEDAPTPEEFDEMLKKGGVICR